MPMHPFHRTELLLGRDGFERVQKVRACVVGLGGVGSYAAEALVRSGVGHITLVDFDRVCITNVNRQVHATRRTVGQFKAELMADRAEKINRRCDIVAIKNFFCEGTEAEVLDPGYDIVLDCIDQMSEKLRLLEACVRRDQPVISAMGAGGRMDPTRIRVSDLFEVHTDPFARIVRKQLRKRGITGGITAVWSDEPPVDTDEAVEEEFQCVCPDKSLKERYSCESRFQLQGSTSWMPPMFGMTMAGVVVNRLLGRAVGETDDELPPGQRPPTNRPTPERRRELLKRAGF